MNEQLITNFYPFSMQLDKDLISRLEKLARLQLDAAERQKMVGDLQGILDMVDKMQEMDTRDVEPLVYLNNETDTLREDEVSNQLPQDEALKNAPSHDGQFFKVPKVIE